MFFTRIAPVLRQRLFTTSTRHSTAISFEDAAATHLSARVSAIPKLGRVARWYLPTMAAVALGMAYIPKQFYQLEYSRPARRTVTLGDANHHIGFGVTNALNDANHQVHVAPELTQEQKNMLLMDSYGERSSLEDMERAIAGLDSKSARQTTRNKVLEEAYGERRSIKDLERAMQIYEVQ